eukprot:CAMPEP_0185724216 /NCGR_PEP_ID=MMETSP1171-20130828/765_1 /TAXON_ID=374046 /ORGANISM="Helicotheca tamensis, Strain CCMP826" /LENGTH=174 /DNA_ID=CAMNT_0028392019 /DNA_START=62 /DNA_END=586 /DNA_ORIENTATION=-
MTGRDHTDRVTSLGKNSKTTSREHNISRRKSRGSIKGIYLGKLPFETDDDSVSSVGTDLSISDSFIQAFENAFGRDSNIITRERSDRTVIRRQSSGSIRVTTSEVILPDLQESASVDDDISVDDSAVRGIAQSFEQVFGRDSHIVTRERSMRRTSRASITGITIELSVAEEETE